MCGILGILNLSDKKISKINFMNMLDTLEHRGPDDTGYFDNDYISFGHKRLSIIDLSKKARQPMKSENGRYALIYNGEIYNYKKLRKILKILVINLNLKAIQKSFYMWHNGRRYC